MGSRYNECSTCTYAYCTNFSTPCNVCKQTMDSKPSEFREKIKAIKTWDKDSTGYDAVLNAFRTYNPMGNVTTKVVYQDYIPLQIKKVIFNDPATIVFWSTGDKTVVKCAPEDEFDPEKGLAMAICKKMLGDKVYKSTFKNFIPKAEQVCDSDSENLRVTLNQFSRSSESLGNALAESINKAFKRWNEERGPRDET